MMIAIFVALVTGLVLGCAFPPVGLGFLAHVALVPFLIWMKGKRLRSVFVWAFLTAVVFHLFTVSWIRHITWAGMIASILMLSLIFTIPFLIMALSTERWPRQGMLILPFAVAGTEWVRSFDVLAFPWMILGNSQAAYPWLIQFADITSVFGISWWIVMANVAVYRLIERRTVFRWVTPVFLFIIPFVYSAVVITHPTPSGDPVKIALIQGNVYPDEKWSPGNERWNIDLYRNMSIDAMPYKPDLFIWPETATPVYLCEEPRYLYMVQWLADSTGVPVLTGTPAYDFDTDRKWNAACLIEPYHNNVERYEKIHLVPFGEAIPFDNLFPGLQRIELGQANWDEGRQKVVFEPDNFPKFNVAICFESIFPDLIRQFVVNGSQFIVVITNDVWFGPIASPIQHAMISAIRAIEFHRPVARCANTGISMFIDRYGRIINRTATFERDTLIGSIEPNENMTFYARYGNIFSITCLIVTVIVLAVIVVTRRDRTARTS